MSARRPDQLKRLLEIRRYQEACRRQELGAALRQEHAALAAQAARRQELLALQDELRRVLHGGAAEPASLRGMQLGLLHGEGRLDDAGAELGKARTRRLRCEEEFHAARQRSRSLERLDDKRSEAEALRRRRDEQKETDEVALVRHLEAAGRAVRPAVGRAQEDRDG